MLHSNSSMLKRDESCCALNEAFTIAWRMHTLKQQGRLYMYKQYIAPDILKTCSMAGSSCYYISICLHMLSRNYP